MRSDFLNVLESLRLPARFQAGRRIFRAEGVRGLSITSSIATANVDDEELGPQRVKIAVRAFSAIEWQRVEQALAAEAINAAKLLAGEVPDGLDAVLASLGLSLLPATLDEVALACSCVGFEPCVHVIATWYALADEFDRDPFHMLAWRGRARDDLLEHVRVPRAVAEPVVVEAAARDFWAAGPRVRRPPSVTPRDSRRPDAVLDQLDPLPLRLHGRDVVDLLRPYYGQRP